MGYRINSKPPRPKRRDVQATTTPGHIYLHNGETAVFAFPCLYYEMAKPQPAHCHSRMHHDHIGWPSPSHPDHVCQEWDFAHSCCRPAADLIGHGMMRCKEYMDMSKVSPIHLKAEGYKNFEMRTDAWKKGAEVPDIQTACALDTDDDWIIRATITAKITGLYDPAEYRYTIAADGDIVTIGHLTILPAA